MAGPQPGTAPTAPSTAPPPNVFDQSAAAYNQAVGIGQNMPTLQQGMQSFQNPYQEAVLDNTLGRLEDSFQQRLMNIGDQAIANDAFGGQRMGLVEATAFDDYLRNVGETSANINRQGFMDAGALAGQAYNQQLGQANLLSNLANQGFGFGRQLNQDQMGMGDASRGLQQAIIDATNQQFNAANPLNWIGSLQTGLSGSPLMQNYTGGGSNQYKPSAGERIGQVIGTIAGIK